MPLALSRRPLRPPPRPGTASVEDAEPPIINETDLDRILKLIPTEVLALYTGALPIAAEVPSRHFPFVMFVVGLVLVPTVLFLDGRATGQYARWPQYLLRMLSFAVWAMACSWPFGVWFAPANARWIVALGVLLVPFIGGLLTRESAATPTPT